MRAIVQSLYRPKWKDMWRTLNSWKLHAVCKVVGSGSTSNTSGNHFKFYSTTEGNECLDLSGIFPPIATPFNPKTGTRATCPIDYDQLQNNFSLWNEIPFKGYVVLGSNGEAIALTRTEKLNLLKATRNMGRKGTVIIAGLGCYGTEETIELCQEVGDSKAADAALIITPSFFKGQMTDSALITHYSVIADNSPLPILLYNVPANTNIDLSHDLIKILSTHSNIIGLKESGGDITKISRILHETNGIRKDFHILAGSAGFLLPALLMGCVGGICALGNVLGSELCQLYELFKQKDWNTAVALQKRLITPNFMVTQRFGVAGLKYSMDLKGFYGGPCRFPLETLTPAQKKILEDAFVSQRFVFPKLFAECRRKE